MTDQTTDQSGNDDGASDQPAETSQAPDLEAIVTRVAAALDGKLDKRFQGFQSVIDKKIGTLQRELQAASLSPEEREQFDAQTTEAETDALRRQVALFELAEQFPKAAPLMRQIMSADSLDAQLALIEQSFGAGAAAQAAQAAASAEAPASPAETVVPEVDRNNPSRTVEQGLASALSADEMTDAAADAILGSLGKGGLVTSRKVNQTG